MNREKLALAAGCAAFIAAVATAQPSQAPQAPAFAVPPYKNLQVLPKDISRADLLNNMKFFAQSLGVRCTHCHVGVEGQPLSTFDFASDAKEHKLAARAMMRMVNRLNSQELPSIPGIEKDAKVTCYTCHRGSTKPLTALPTAPPPAPAQPPPAATERGSS